MRSLLTPGPYLAIAATLAAASAAAASGTAAVSSTASVQSACSVLTPAVEMNFGTVDPLVNAGVNARPAVTLTCNRGAAVTMQANAGSNPLGAQKRMRNGTGADTLAYHILQPRAPNFTVCPGNVPAGTELAASPLTLSQLWATAGGARDIVLCGRLNLPQTAAGPGLYTDSVVLTFAF